LDSRLLFHYNNELTHLRQTAAEFAREFPKIAGRLLLDKEAKEACPDPFVERLLEGFAFLTARIQVKMDAEFPRFTQSLLETVYPHYLCPTPSMAVVRFEPILHETSLAAGSPIPRGTTLRAPLRRGERTACEYRTAHDITLWPLQIEEAKYYTRELAQFNLPGRLGARAVLRIRLRTSGEISFQSLPIERLKFFLRGADELPNIIYEQIFSRAVATVVMTPKATPLPEQIIPAERALRRVGFAPEEALLPEGPRSFSGYRLLREYFAFRQRFLFFEAGGLGPALQQCAGDAVDLLIVFREQDARLENSVDADSLALFCAPVINLFPKRADRIALGDRYSEYQVIVDRTRPFDFEVFDLQSVTGFGMQAGEEQQFQPFYLSREGDANAGAFYTVHRAPRNLSAKERTYGRQTNYAGTEVFLSLVDAGAAPYRGDLQQLGVSTLCTNRHLPMELVLGQGNTDFTMELNAPVAAVRCVSGPTAPRPPFGDGEIVWRLISHLSLNYLSLLDAPNGEGASGLREMLKLYADAADAQTQKQIEALKSASASPVLRRLEGSGPITFVRGLEVKVLFDETPFEGIGVFVLGGVLEQFFRRYVAINSFTETVIQTEQRKEIMRWKAQIGQRPIF
jgi:type VI secretion system protein ImpG